MLRKITLLALLLGACFMGMNAQSIKGKEDVSYFQAPAQGVKFEKANVFISYDQALSTAKKEAQKGRNSAMGSKFGAIGTAVANTANKAIDMMDKFNTVLDEFKDEEGRFAVWDFVPSYIVADAETKNRVNVEIFILNEPNPEMGHSMPTTPDKDGYYSIPYYVNCRYKITTDNGTLLHEENLGALSGTRKTKNYTPEEAPSMGGGLSSMVTVEEEDEDGGIPIEDEIGTNVAYNAVRTSVFSRFGFAQLEAPIKLGVVKESKVSKKMIKPTLAVFENKVGLVLSEEDKVQVSAFVAEMEKVLPSTSEKTKWVALHNLSVCYAWLEDIEKAQKYYTMYGEEISTTILKMECWNKVLNKEMTAKEMKAKCGTTFMGPKDQKRFTQYNNISNFVNFYPSGAQRYATLIKAVNRDLKRFVDYYAVNDLLCQLFEIDFPYQFFPLQDMKGAPKDCRATITKEGMEPIEYRVKYNMKRKIKELQADQVSRLEDGSKEKLFTRDIMPKYSESGSYSHLETDAGSWSQSFAGGGMYTKLNYINDPLERKTVGRADNITKKAGFFGGKVSNEFVRLKVDLDGNIYFTGESEYFKANAFFKDIMNANGITPKNVNTDTKFSTKTSINDQGVMNDWTWDGFVKTYIGAGLSTRSQSLTADQMVRGIKYLEIDENGNPTKAEYIFKLKGSMDIEAKMSLKEWFEKSYAQGHAPRGDMSSENIDITQDGVWDCTFEYDEQGNWTNMQIGPYTATREIKY